MSSGANQPGIIYWHGELPPSDSQAMDEHVLEAVSSRIPGTLAHRDELWDRCYDELMAQARERLKQEVLVSEAITHTCSMSRLTADMTTSRVKPGYTVVSRTCCMVDEHNVCLRD